MRSKLQDFEILNRIGSGSFGTVFKVKRIIDNNIYVIKNVRIVELPKKEQQDAINEVQILAQLDSLYVVKYFDSFIQKDSLHIGFRSFNYYLKIINILSFIHTKKIYLNNTVMEFCNRGDLQNLLKKAKEKNVTCLKEDIIWNILLQVVLGLLYLHQRKILHRDLKSANVFLTKEDNNKTTYAVKIGDLGVAKLMDTSTALANTIVGTP
jgi:NIMA (never in mitosis gene a)-related kinase